MVPFEIAIRIEAAGRAGDDRAVCHSIPAGHLIVLADGAGGTSRGAEAADAVVERARSSAPGSAVECVRFLEALDRDLATVGETTAVLVVVSEGSLFGASVGDSVAWLVGSSEFVDLTRDQCRKPLLGSGRARPVAFGPCDAAGRIVVGSDGLFNYVSGEQIRSLVTTLPLAAAADTLVEATRLPSGGLQDDVSVVVGEWG